MANFFSSLGAALPEITQANATVANQFDQAKKLELEKQEAARRQQLQNQQLQMGQVQLQQAQEAQAKRNEMVPVGSYLAGLEHFPEVQDTLKQFAGARIKKDANGNEVISRGDAEDLQTVLEKNIAIHVPLLQAATMGAHRQVESTAQKAADASTPEDKQKYQVLLDQQTGRYNSINQQLEQTKQQLFANSPEGIRWKNEQADRERAARESRADREATWMREQAQRAADQQALREVIKEGQAGKESKVTASPTGRLKDGRLTAVINGQEVVLNANGAREPYQKAVHGDLVAARSSASVDQQKEGILGPDRAAKLVDMTMAGKIPPDMLQQFLGGRMGGTGNTNRMQFLDALLEKYPDADLAAASKAFSADKAALGKAEVQKIMVSSFSNKADIIANKVQDLIKDYTKDHGTGYPWADTRLMDIKVGAGADKIKAIQLQMISLADEWARIVSTSGTGGSGQTAESKMRQIEQVFAPGSTLGQVKELADGVMFDSAAARKGVQKAINDANNETRDFSGKPAPAQAGEPKGLDMNNRIRKAKELGYSDAEIANFLKGQQ